MVRLKRFNKNENRGLKKALIIVSICLVVSLVISATMTYAVYQKEVEIPFINARVGEFTVNDIQLAMLLDGKEVEAPPEKNELYTVTIDCDKATGRWDMDEWGAMVTNITAGKVKCEVNFSTPEPTLSEVTANTSIDYKTLNPSISLSYTAGGIGTITTCKYGKEEENYTNIVETATNTNCEISIELEKDMTYYYQVCAVNGGGETCNIGNIKTLKDVISNLVEIGDYVSMTPKSTSYTITSDLTGYSYSQTINPSELNLWRVIKKNEDGTADMVSENLPDKPTYFKGTQGVMNLSGSLQIIAAQYTDGVHVTKTRHMGYGGQKLKCYSPFTYDLSNNDCDSEHYGYSDLKLVKEATGGYCPERYLGARTKCWTPDRALGTSSSSKGWGARYASTTYDGWETMYSVNSDGSTQTESLGWYIRPIVTVGEDTRLISGDGKTAETAYQLG